LYVASITKHNASLPITEVSEQNIALFTHKWKPVVSHKIWTILQRWAAEFCKAEFGKISWGKQWALHITH